jgi:hypothetical protein
MNVNHVGVSNRPASSPNRARMHGDRCDRPVGRDSDGTAEQPRPRWSLLARRYEPRLVAGHPDSVHQAAGLFLNASGFFDRIWANNGDSHGTARSDGQFG